MVVEKYNGVSQIEEGLSLSLTMNNSNKQSEYVSRMQLKTAHNEASLLANSPPVTRAGWPIRSPIVRSTMAGMGLASPLRTSSSSYVSGNGNHRAVANNLKPSTFQLSNFPHTGFNILVQSTPSYTLNRFFIFLVPESLPLFFPHLKPINWSALTSDQSLFSWL